MINYSIQKVKFSLKDEHFYHEGMAFSWEKYVILNENIFSGEVKGVESMKIGLWICETFSTKEAGFSSFIKSFLPEKKTFCH